MSALSGVPPYWLNFLLHTALLSTFVWLGCLLIRDPGRRAFAAAAGVFAVAAIPWFSALRPPPSTNQAKADVPVKTESHDWSSWTIRIETSTASRFQTPSTIESSPVLAAKEPLDWGMIVLGLWVAGAALGLFAVTTRLVKFGSWWATLRPPSREEGEWLASYSPVDRGRFLISGDDSGPCAIGFIRLRMVVPESLLQGRDVTKLRWVVRHEAEHLRGGDPRLALLLSLAKCAGWWNPFIHLLTACWAEERERVCDARALSVQGEGRTYGAFLLDLTEMKSSPARTPMAMSGGARRMGKRLRALARGEGVAPSSTTFRTSAILAMIAGAVLVATGEIRTTVGGTTHELIPGAEGSVGPQLIQRTTAEPAAVEATGRAPRSMKVTSSFVQTKDRVQEAGTVITNLEHQLLMRRLAQQVGSDFVTLPPISVADGKNATYAAVHTLPGDRGFEDVRTVPFVGISIISSPKLEGEKVALSVDCQMNFEPDKMRLGLIAGKPDEFWPVPAGNFDWKTIRSATLKATRSLSPGDHLILPVKGLPDGTHIMGMFTVQFVEHEEGPQPGALSPDGPPRIPRSQIEPAAPTTGEDGVRRVPVQIRLSSKLILSDKPIPELGKTLTENELLRLMRNYAMADGVKFMTLPSVVMGSGADSKIEDIREAPGMPAGRNRQYLGISQEALVEISGDSLILTIDSIYNHPADDLGMIFNGFFPGKPPSDVWSKIRTARGKAKVSLKSGEGYLLPFEGVEKGKHLAAICQVDAIDATGRRIDSFGKLIPEEDARLPGDVVRLRPVKIRSAIVNLPREGRLPSYRFRMAELPPEGADNQGSPTRVNLIYPGTDLSSIRDEAVKAGGTSRWQTIGDIQALPDEEPELGGNFPAKVQVSLRRDNSCQLKLTLPGRQKPVRVTGYLEHILSIELDPAVDGTRRILLLALNEP